MGRWDRAENRPLHGATSYSWPLSRTGGYRFKLSDKVTFERQYHFTIEHGPEGNNWPVGYTSVTFYYGERPAISSLDPVAVAGRLGAVRAPRQHHFDVIDLSFRLGAGTSVEFADFSEHGVLMDVGVDRQNRGAVAFASLDEVHGQVRLEFEDLEPGQYRIYLNYKRSPESGELALWRREVPVADFVDAFAEKEEFVRRQDMGVVEFTQEDQSVTLRVRPKKGRTRLTVGTIELERIGSIE